MANQTLIGCIDFATGLAEFDQEDCEYSGCMIWQGLHAGQVAVTIDTILCDDIYYGCVIFPGGTFEVVVPDNCCEFGDPCGECVDTPPKCISMSFTDWEACCFSGIADSRMKVYSLPDLICEQSIFTPCVFGAGAVEDIPGFMELFDYDGESGCSEGERPRSLFFVRLFMTIVITGESTIEIDIRMDIGEFSIPFTLFHATIDGLDDPCFYLLSGHTISNEIQCGDDGDSTAIGGGNVTIAPAGCP